MLLWKRGETFSIWIWLFTNLRTVRGFCYLNAIIFTLQKADGVPVHLKRGVPDRLLYRTTMALTIGGTIYCLVALFLAAQPKKRNWRDYVIVTSTYEILATRTCIQPFAQLKLICCFQDFLCWCITFSDIYTGVIYLQFISVKFVLWPLLRNVRDAA